MNGSSVRVLALYNVQHPTYKTFAELGKAIKTICLCQ
jgi:TnpA family transposase